ncbi:MAG: hypothetical protein A2Y40_03185 [Candidatus Margulisbacteria bacterium GWF2_35_9]|nr:MAG: hypothetical protein A2Y40_03185 [Candidatus Margulisbacteria bacterium GWF2_35_9]
MTESDWVVINKDVNLKMLEYVKHFVTPISKVIDHNTGEHFGTGSYLEIEKTKYLITNDHVAREINNSPLTYQFLDNEDIFKFTNPILAKPDPIDLALVKIEYSAWDSCKHNSLAIPIGCFALNHELMEGELLFILGFAFENSKFYYNYLNTHSTPYLTQEIKLPEKFGDPKFHFGLYYNPDRAIKVNEKSKDLPIPFGMSGSLVWNTRYVEKYNMGKSWAPSDSRVTGILRKWSSGDACLHATKVDYFDLLNIHDASNNITTKKGIENDNYNL